MKATFILASVALSTLFPVVSVAAEASHSDPNLPGRHVKVAAIAIGFGGDRDAKLKLALNCLKTAGEHHVDIACLPEEFCGVTPEPVTGPVVTAVAKLAAEYRMYVICPICEQAGEEQYNTAVLVDREGHVAGHYRKVFVFWNENLHASREGVKIFDTDFGRISILTCFDINFPELWHAASMQGAEVMFWASAYAGGMTLNAYATVHNYYVVGVGEGTIVDCTGVTLAPAETPRENLFITTLDLDRTFVHEDFTRRKLDRLLAEHTSEIEVEQKYEKEGWTLLRSIKPGVRVRDLCAQYEIESLQQYRNRSREQIDQRREAGQRIAADEAGKPL
ncbi:MAG TPA: carbon-nitrogen hydrolase family protein [Candidatus Hydrogenedentes bacterium]|nr:carbon-nitrogen hydrolase family protein [Candidatus Hydrogenedentota bacterium]HQE81943.1 carbon-nitrogen hydrolase family protein [Candidatus Hydrogenedentota bacterium]HQH52231.1 carbon-nitrogen hydrolase family protein [Candidatus Hydrogenedentota bacterium]HQM49072.1 carbon-nitrogen hydrolase family protein [Candidatus Hydrogenedentota bacterium]